MNNIITNWDNIIEESKSLGLPVSKQRAIIREYLQTIILENIYNQKGSKYLSFIGGTSLRLLRGLDRFSEDLDFDNLGASDKNINTILHTVSKKLNNQNIINEYALNILEEGIAHGYYKFPNLLTKLKITSDPREKIRVDIDYTTPKKPRHTENILYSRYGHTALILTNNLSTLAMQKIDAFINRTDPKARDLYDVFWLLSRDIKPNLAASSNTYNNNEELRTTILKRFDSVKSDLDKLHRSLEPFLLEEDAIKPLSLFPALINEKLK